eukprot:m.14331 g.14331  ORF g.14331 m.14331 type:complete len:1206 (+) comp25698_c0_seq1:161-3778(+)
MAADRLYSSCLWCEDPEKAKGLLGRLLVQWERRPKPKWIDEMTNDVSFCRNCMIEYNRAKEENSQWEDGLWRFDVQRIQSSLTKLLNSTDPVFQQFDVIDVDEYACVTDRLHTPLMELIAFPDYLRDAEIGRLFIQAFRLYANRNGRELEVEERLPGLYLLLVHPYQKIRRWALKAVKPLGPIDTNDFDDLESVFKLVFSTIGCSLFSGKCSAPKMPDHLLCDLHDLWVGIVMMMTAMDSHTLKSRFLVPGRFQPVVPKVVSALREQPTFWPAFQCFVLLLERIKSRIWEMAGSSPQAIFHYITTNGCYIEELQQMAASPNSLDESLVPARSVDGDSDGGNDEAEMATADVLSNSQIAYNWNGQASVKRRGNCFHSTTFGWFLDFLMSFANDVKTALDVFPLLLHFLLNSPERISPNHFPEPDLLQLSLLFVKCTSTLLKLIHYCLIEKKFEIISSSGDMWIPFLLDCSQVKKRFTRGGQPDGSMIEIDELSLIAKQSRQLLISLLRKTPESILRNSDIAGLASDENPRTRRTCVRVHYLSENEMQRFVGRIKDSLEKLLKFTPKPEPSQAVDADADSVVVIDLTECSGGESPDLFSPQTSSSSDDEDSQDRVKLIQWRKRRAVLLEPDSDSSDEDFVRPQRVSDDVLQLKKKYRRGKETTQDEDSTSVLLSMCRKMSYRPKFIIPLTLARVKLPEPEPEPEPETEVEAENLDSDVIGGVSDSPTLVVSSADKSAVEERNEFPSSSPTESPSEQTEMLSSEQEPSIESNASLFSQPETTEKELEQSELERSVNLGDSSSSKSEGTSEETGDVKEREDTESLSEEEPKESYPQKLEPEEAVELRRSPLLHTEESNLIPTRSPSLNAVNATNDEGAAAIKKRITSPVYNQDLKWSRRAVGNPLSVEERIRSLQRSSSTQTGMSKSRKPALDGSMRRGTVADLRSRFSSRGSSSSSEGEPDESQKGKSHGDRMERLRGYQRSLSGSDVEESYENTARRQGKEKDRPSLVRVASVVLPSPQSHPATTRRAQLSRSQSTDTHESGALSQPSINSGRDSLERDTSSITAQPMTNSFNGSEWKPVTVDGGASSPSGQSAFRSLKGQPGIGSVMTIAGHRSGSHGTSSSSGRHVEPAGSQAGGRAATLPTNFRRDVTASQQHPVARVRLTSLQTRANSNRVVRYQVKVSENAEGSESRRNSAQARLTPLLRNK